MAGDLAALTAETFEPLVGETFRLIVDEDVRLSTVLESVDRKGEQPAYQRWPFSLVLGGPLEPQLRQGIYRIEHAELGLLEIFIVPIGRDEDGVRYEAVFG